MNYHAIHSIHSGSWQVAEPVSETMHLGIPADFWATNISIRSGYCVKQLQVINHRRWDVTKDAKMLGQTIATAGRPEIWRSDLVGEASQRLMAPFSDAASYPSNISVNRPIAAWCRGCGSFRACEEDGRSQDRLVLRQQLVPSLPTSSVQYVRIYTRISDPWECDYPGGKRVVNTASFKWGF